MIRRDQLQDPTAAVSDVELGIAVVLLGIALLLAVILVPLVA